MHSITAVVGFLMNVPSRVVMASLSKYVHTRVHNNVDGDGRILRYITEPRKRFIRP